MSFYDLKQRIYSVLRPLFILLAVALVTLCTTQQYWAPWLGEWWLKKQDNYWVLPADNFQPTNAQIHWERLLDLGDISRHHRYADFKTNLFLYITANSIALKDPDTLTDWAKKNRRDQIIQQQLVEYQQQNNLKVYDRYLNELSSRFQTNKTAIESPYLKAYINADSKASEEQAH
jgi:hypothetical protein